ncbi:MAG: GntR family transcriptional regulator [Planctomycetia bacterium]|nr:GntR family transcriptional regulator [Planctomycetia bacterium]
MQTKSEKEKRANSLVSRLLEDIRARNLQVGDPFYTTIQASEFLGVSCSQANRALQTLEEIKIITRAQKKGARIASIPDKNSIYIQDWAYPFEG